MRSEASKNAVSLGCDKGLEAINSECPLRNRAGPQVPCKEGCRNESAVSDVKIGTPQRR